MYTNHPGNQMVLLAILQSGEDGDDAHVIGVPDSGSVTDAAAAVG